MRIFKIEQEGYWVFVTIFSFKFRFLKIKKLISDFAVLFEKVNEILNYNQKYNKRILSASIINYNAFINFRGINRGRSVVLVGAGPTVNFFEPIQDAIYVGCNRAFLFDKLSFDYLFTIDKVGIQDYYKEFFEYRPDSCIKFVGDQNIGKAYQIPENIIPINSKTYRYITDAGIENEQTDKFPLDISVQPLYNSTTVSIQALQFILWTQPEKIYLVGIDCTGAKHKHFTGNSPDVSFRGENLQINDEIAIESYKLIKEFANIYYPYTEIISINPVGLKGIFKDVYIKSYLDRNEKDTELFNFTSINCNEEG